MNRPAEWSRATWWQLPREARRNERSLFRWCASFLKKFYAPHTKSLVASFRVPLP